MFRAHTYRVPAAILLAGLLAVAGPARAQTTTTMTVNPVIDRNTTPNRPAGLKTNQVTLNDCLADVVLTYSISIVGPIPNNNSFQVWAGSGDCSPLTARNGSSTSICWPVTAGPVTAQATTKVPVRVRDLVGNLGKAQKPITYSAAGLEACNSQSTSGVSTISVWFLFLDAALNPTSQANVAMDVDMVGPTGPTEIQAGEADRTIVVKWTPPTNSGSDRTGFNVYCAPADSIPPELDASVPDTTDAAVNNVVEVVCEDGGFTDGGFDDAGNPLPGEAIDGGCTLQIGDGGTDASTATTDPTCPTPSFLQLCQTVGESSEAHVSDLTNGVRYSVAVAAVDKFGNPGPRSRPQCVIPGPVADFFHNYRAAGGQAGGCALEGAGLPAGGTLVFAASSAVVVALLRRKRRNNAS